MKELNQLKDIVKELKKSVALLSNKSLQSTPPNFCHVRVILHNPSYITIDNASLSDLLGCPIINSLRVGSSLKVKIPKECLYTAIQSSSASSHLVQVWKNKHCSHTTAPSTQKPTSTLISMGHSLSIGTWNCRGI